MRFLSGPIISSGGFVERLLKSAIDVLRHPLDFLRTHVMPGWAQRTTILLVMQTAEESLRVRLGRSPFTLFRRDLVSRADAAKAPATASAIGTHVARAFGERMDGIALGSVNEGLFGIPMTAHILGGCPMGRTADEGVVDLRCAVHGYPGLHVVDGSIVPGNPGVNPSLTIAAMAEYAMSCVPARESHAPGNSMSRGHARALHGQGAAPLP